jgi:cytidylate kinase
MDPYEHDAVLAAASHLPQLAASSLVTAFQELSRSTPQALNFFGGGFRDTTRVASSAPEMWRDICLYNREQILKALDQLREAIDTARARIASGDGGELLAFFEGAKAFRDMLMADGPGNGGQAPQGLTITIDGTAGAGKSTIAKLLSRRLGYKYIDTGAIYRTVALCAVEEGIPLNDEDGLTALCRRIKIDQRLMDGELRVFCRDRDITERIRSPEMGMNASIVSAHPRVREELLGAQREMARGGRVVAEGRDVGSVVLPGADIKIYLDASLEVRAKRRYLQAGGEESKFNLEKTIDSIKKRDEQDKGRAVSPLKIPSNAVVIDSGETDVQETLNEILSLLKKRFPDIVHPVIKDIIN